MMSATLHPQLKRQEPVVKECGILTLKCVSDVVELLLRRKEQLKGELAGDG